MDIRKIKFNTKDKTLEVSYSIFNGTASNEITTKSGNIVHSDFIDAINALRYHFARLTDLRECMEINEKNERIEKLHEHTALRDIQVTGVTFSNSCDTESVCIIGNKRFNGKHINLTSPLTVLDADEYVYHWELEQCLKTLREETQEYIEHQKWGVKQQSLFDPLADEFAQQEADLMFDEDTGVVMEAPISAAESMLEQFEKKAKRGRKPKLETQTSLCS